MILDYHNAATFPDACQKSDTPTDVWVMNAIVVNDTDFANFLKTYYGLPASGGQIDLASSTQGSAEVHYVNWTIGNGPANSVAMLDTHDAVDGVRNNDRVFWQQGSKLWSLDLAFKPKTPLLTNRAYVGTFSPPMLDSRTGTPIAHQGDWYPADSIEGQLTEYANLSCSK
jgi:hypothetical protein